MEKQSYLNFNLDKSIDLILPAYNESASIKKSIESFESLKLFNNIIVVDNNSTDDTAVQIKKTKALYCFEKKQGYGAAMICGFKHSEADIIITCEPDLTFSHLDTYKFLSYLNDFDCVFGTRTSKSMIEVGAKMNLYLRYGNIFVAKILEYLFSGPSLTDVGCSYKAFKKKSIKKICNNLTILGSHFQPELMINLIEQKNKIIEIPVFYLKRKGYSKITYNFSSSFKVAIQMLMLIFKLFILKFIKSKILKYLKWF